MLTEMLDKYFKQNQWYDLTNLDELIKLTGLDETSIRVIKKLLFPSFVYTRVDYIKKIILSWHETLLEKQKPKNEKEN